MCTSIIRALHAIVFSWTIATIFSTTIDTIQNEGLACFEMASAIPGLKTLTGTDFNYSTLFFMAISFPCNFDSFDRVDYSLYCSKNDLELNRTDISLSRQSWRAKLVYLRNPDN